ncbi:hypothetical protein CEXT_360731 [Caerostris extrusa]|uniref:Maturase K n=1 Tax=Caerostris extrusa TaxID=172846 RepID=A0AAV4XJG9_CAEEX|nr:hypothetical protein CEXT_360731 [Caerostris extrusa]
MGQTAETFTIKKDMRLEDRFKAWSLLKLVKFTKDKLFISLKDKSRFLRVLCTLFRADDGIFSKWFPDRFNLSNLVAENMSSLSEDRLFWLKSRILRFCKPSKAPSRISDMVLCCNINIWTFGQHSKSSESSLSSLLHDKSSICNTGSEGNETFSI